MNTDTSQITPPPTTRLIICDRLWFIDGQTPVEVLYKGRPAGHYVPELVVDDAVLCEIKAVAALAPEHEAQLLNYLKATGIRHAAEGGVTKDENAGISGPSRLCAPPQMPSRRMLSR